MEYFAAIAPSVGVGLIFWFTMRAIMRADRKERMEQAAFEAKEELQKRKSST